MTVLHLHDLYFRFELRDKLVLGANRSVGQMPDFEPFVETSGDEAVVRDEAHMRDFFRVADTGNEVLLGKVVRSCEHDELAVTCDDDLLAIRTPGHLKPLS